MPHRRDDDDVVLLMAAQPPKRPPSRAQLQTGTSLGDPATSRLLSDLGTARAGYGVAVTGRLVRSCSRSRSARTPSIMGLSCLRPRMHCATPTVVDATFAWAMTSADDRQLQLTVAGAAQPNAVVRVF